MTSSKACCKRIQALDESWIGGPWKSLPALRVCNSTAAKPLQEEVLNPRTVTMGANGAQGEESSVWAGTGKAFWGWRGEAILRWGAA